MIKTTLSTLLKTYRQPIHLNRWYLNRCRFHTNVKLLDQFENIRNFGIIAHIDAGKTTTTERLLYHSGSLKRMGEVHTGDTVTDYLAQERERGITIQSAAITFDYKGHQLNLIDTPGHVDFTMEVERSIRVLDGAIAIIDAVSGVQPQTETVWKQADRYDLPRLVFINKLDRDGADFFMAIKQIKQSFGVIPLVCQIPLFKSSKGSNQDELVGIIDLIKMKKLIFINQIKPNGWEQQFIMKQEELNNEEQTILLKHREILIESICELDDSFLDLYLEKGDILSIKEEEIKKCVRNLSINNKLVPILCGSSLKNFGIQPLLDSIIDYLPNPKDRPLSKVTTNKNEIIEVNLDNQNTLCALAFKVIYDPLRGPMTFIRVYSGVLNNKSTLINSNLNLKERINKLFKCYANEYEEIQCVPSGQFGIAIGLKNTRTGDTLVSNNNKQLYQLEGLSLPKPVFMCAIEPHSTADEPALLEALKHLILEDPSLSFNKDENSGQILLGGMGELHLDIVKHKMINELKLNIEFSKVYINYKETIINDTNQTSHFNDLIMGVSNSCTMDLTIQNHTDQNLDEYNLLEDNNYLSIQDRIIIEDKDLKYKLNPENKLAIIEGLKSAISRGGPNGYSLTQLLIKINNIRLQNDTNVATILSKSIYKGLQESINQDTNNIKVLEPIMKLNITSNNKYFGTILSDLTNNRKGKINFINEHENKCDIEAEVPLSSMLGYSSILRSISQGQANFFMNLKGYD